MALTTITSGMLPADIISDHTNIGATPAGSDELLLSDAGVLKAVTVTNLSAAAGGLFSSYAVIADEKAANTHSGTFTQDGWRVRDINDEITDPDNIVTAISSNEFTLAAGSYLIRWSAPAYQVQAHQTKLYDETADADIKFGSAEFAEDDSGGITASRSFGAARVTPSGSNAYTIQHYCADTTGSSGFGERNNFGNVLYFTIVEIFKEA